LGAVYVPLLVPLLPPIVPPLPPYCADAAAETPRTKAIPKTTWLTFCGLISPPERERPVAF
jgi:hypothetical protein